MADKRASLAELMGKKASDSSSLSLSQLPEILGNMMPDLPKTQVGRYRLIRSLQQRFGANFRSLPGIKDLIAEFDRDLELERKVAQMKAIKYDRPSRKE